MQVRAYSRREKSDGFSECVVCVFLCLLGISASCGGLLSPPDDSALEMIPIDMFLDEFVGIPHDSLGFPQDSFDLLTRPQAKVH